MNLPDAPESVKYYGGYDPADPPYEDNGEMATCDCGHKDYEEEIIEVNGKTFCVNCHPTFEDKLNDWLDRFVAWIEKM